MCVISLFCDGSNKKPTLDDLEKMNTYHAHGSGIAFLKSGYVHYRKGIDLTPEKIMKMIKEENIKMPFVVHFRITSSGKTCKKNCYFDNPDKNHNCACHGFILDKKGKNPQKGKTKKGILFHNGTISENELDLDIKHICLTEKIDKPDFVSDSHKIAFLVAHYGDRYLDLIPKTEKFAILTPNSLTYYNEYEKDSNGNLVSNTWHDDERYNFGYCMKSDCLEHDYINDECLIEDNKKYYKVDKKDVYHEIDEKNYDDYMKYEKWLNDYGY